METKFAIIGGTFINLEEVVAAQTENMGAQIGVHCYLRGGQKITLIDDAQVINGLLAYLRSESFYFDHKYWLSTEA